MGIQGTVVLKAIITTTGSVEEIQVLKPVHPRLDAAADRAVRQWRYKPATLNTRAVRVFLSVSVAFTLH
jgi:periplasmic protein TonB